MSTARRPHDDRIDPFDPRLFVAVLEHGSITAAARAMSLSLAAASTRLKALLVGALRAASRCPDRPTEAQGAVSRLIAGDDKPCEPERCGRSLSVNAQTGGQRADTVCADASAARCPSD